VGSAEGAAAVVVGGGMFSVMFVGVGGKCVLSGLEGRWTQSVDWRKRAQGWIVCVTCSGVCGSRAIYDVRGALFRAILYHFTLSRLPLC